MRTFTSSIVVAAALLLILVPACEPKAGTEDTTDGETTGTTTGEGETTGEERTLEEWITTCESQTNQNDCEAVMPGTVDGETVRCEQLDIIQTNVADCLITVNDSHCFAVSEAPPPVPGYIYTDPDAQAWLIEAPQDTTVHGSAIEACELADDGMTWMPNPLCGCAGEAQDETGA
jgi:hypothetical protein